MNKDRLYFPGLDFLRFFASFAVLIWHLQEQFWGNLHYKFTLNDNMGRIAVAFFFCLSGFLLTHLLFMEWNKKNNIKIIDFFIRRILRIWPLYYAVLLFAFYLYPYLLSKITGYSYVEKASEVLYFTFLSNYDIVNGVYPVNKMLGVQWSLAVEEQFYIVLPLMFLIFFRNKIFGLLIVLSCVLFSLYYKFTVFPYYDTFSVLHSVFFGVLLAILINYFSNYLKKIILNVWFKRVLLTSIFIYFGIMQFNVTLYSNYLVNPIAYFYEDFVFCSLIYLFCFDNYIVKLINNKVSSFLSELGKNYTYGLYLLHPIAIAFSTLVLNNVLHLNSFALFFFVSIIFSAFICYFSKVLLEDPFMKLKKFFYR